MTLFGFLNRKNLLLSLNTETKEVNEYDSVRDDQLHTFTCKVPIISAPQQAFLVIALNLNPSPVSQYLMCPKSLIIHFYTLSFLFMSHWILDGPIFSNFTYYVIQKKGLIHILLAYTSRRFTCTHWLN